MKLGAVLAAFAAITAGVSAESCVYTNVAPQLHSLGPVIATCITATDNVYSIARATEPPTPEQAVAICEKCGEFVEAVSSQSWPDCTMNMGGKDQTLGAYFDTMIGGCKAVETTAPPAAKPVTGESEYGSASGSAKDSSDVSESPATPVPAATSSGYTLAVGAFAATAVATTLIVVA